MILVLLTFLINAPPLTLFLSFFIVHLSLFFFFSFFIVLFSFSFFFVCRCHCFITSLQLKGVLLNKDSLKNKRGQPPVDIVGMLAWGLDSALKGCSPMKCPTGEGGMASGLWDPTSTSFVSHTCPNRGISSIAPSPTDATASMGGKQLELKWSTTITIMMMSMVLSICF